MSRTIRSISDYPVNRDRAIAQKYTRVIFYGASEEKAAFVAAMAGGCSISEVRGTIRRETAQVSA